MEVIVICCQQREVLLNLLRCVLLAIVTLNLAWMQCNSTHIIVDRTTHNSIPAHQAVIDAIREVVEEVQAQSE